MTRTDGGGLDSTPTLLVLPRDWRSLANRALYLVPLAVSSLLLGFSRMGLAFVPVAVMVIAATSALVTALQWAQVRRAKRPGNSYLVNASVGRTAGRLRIDPDGLSWWSYPQRHGDPELSLAREAIQNMTVQPVAAAFPLCRLRTDSPREPEGGFVLSMSSRALVRLLNAAHMARPVGES